MIAFTKKSIGIPLVIAGGVRTSEAVYDCISSGADIVHVGSAIEAATAEKDVEAKLRKMVEAAKKGAKDKKK
jgi:NAD(P)H-dependent flavin oxidoreductase YrpB (nitropropane dioxygenase family)